jgi:hypothetical protein
VPVPSDALERTLRAREPAVRLVSELALLRALATALEAGERVPDNPRLPLWVPAERMPELPVEPGQSKLLLVTTPDDRLLHGTAPADVFVIYSRLLDRAKFAAIADDAEYRALPEPVRREIRFVLESDHQLPSNATEVEVGRTFHAVVAELRANRPDAIADVFPLLAACDSSADHVHADSQLANVAWPNVTEVVAGTKNHVRRAIEYHRRPEDRATAVGILCEGLGVRLRETLLLDEADSAKWNAALAALLPHTASATWTPAAKALYELQKMALDLAGPQYAVAPFEWLRSFGKRPLKQPLDKARDIIRLRHLAKAERHLARVPLDAAARHAWERLLGHERHAAEERIRETLSPILRDALDRAGLLPNGRVETVAREKLVAELIHVVGARGFFRLADLRDAIARNNLKLQDLDGAREIAGGDELLRADKILGQELFGIYQRGEIYLRGIQRMSAAGFGTPIGRAVALFLLLPFGGAFLALEFLQHVAHGAAGLGAAVGLLDEGHHPHLVHWWTLAPLGLFFLGLVNSREFRSAVGRACARLGSALATVFVRLPRTLWRSRAVRFAVESRVVQYFWRTVALPLALGCIASLVTVLYSEIFSPGIAVGVGVLAFAVSFVAIHSPPGRLLYDTLAEAALDTGRFLWASLFPGLVSWVVWAFREVADTVERMLYAADEALRFREGQSKEMLWLKVAVGVVWFPIAYVTRFVFYLLVEPQVNPVKHFPVVTVSHKVIWPMVPQLSRWTGLSPWTMGTIVNAIPGIFGFIAWELKENWRLYAANRPERLRPVPIGHHGETMRGLLRPGFHSGTVPKLFRKLRALRDAANPDDRKHHHLRHELHHVAEAVQRQVEWELTPFLNDPATWVDAVTLGCRRIEARLTKGEGRLMLSWELIDGEIVGETRFENWTATADESAAVAGMHAAAAAARPEPPAWSDWVKRWDAR